MSPAKILLVVLSDEAADSMTRALLSAGYSAVIRTTEFNQAKMLLDGRPTLLVADIKLGAFNGLHLAIRAGAIGTPAVVIGDPDRVLELDAKRFGVTYLRLPLDLEAFLGAATPLLTRAALERRSIRRPVRDVEALIDDGKAQLLDVSYEGMRIEAAAQTSLPRYFEIRVPRFKFACQVERIWTAPAGDSSHLRCGAALFPANLEAALEWRALVDALPSATPPPQALSRR